MALRSADRRQLQRMRKRATFQYQDKTDDDMGGQTVEWKDLETRWVEIEPVTGSQRLHLDALQSSVTHNVRLRYSETDIPGHASDRYNTFLRMKMGDRIFNIESVRSLEERDAIYELDAAEQ